MNEQLKQAFIQYLQLKSGAQNQQELEAYIQQLGEEGLKQEYAQFMQLVQLQQQLQQVQAARFGAKLNYINTLRGNCPAGTEMQYFQQGGNICKKCMQKVEMKNGGKAQNVVDAFKCGRKMKKANKKPELQEGGRLASFAKAADPDSYREGNWKVYDPYYLKNGLQVLAELIYPHKYPNGEYYPNVHMSLEGVPETGDSTIYISGNDSINKWTKGKDAGFRGAANLWEKAKKATKLLRK